MSFPVSAFCKNLVGVRQDFGSIKLCCEKSCGFRA